MENIICGLLFTTVLAYLAYRGYRFFAKDEICTCFGEHYRWKNGREKDSAPLEEGRPNCPVE